MLTCEESDYKPPKIHELIQKHQKVFQELPMELPPNRKTEHLMELELGQNLSISKRTDIPITIKQRSKG